MGDDRDRVKVLASDGTALGEARVRDDGSVCLTVELETSVWHREGLRLHESLARMDALRSGRITVHGDGIPRMDNGEPVTDEIMREWGWTKAPGGGWKFP